MIKLIPITLNEEELNYCAEVGKLRRDFAINNGLKAAYSGDANISDNILGVQGELVVCKYFNVKHIQAVGYTGHFDVGKLGVRTAAKQGYRLILHDRDSDDQPFILVTKGENCFYIVGWIMGKDGKNEKYWSDPKGGRPAYFIPQFDLRSDIDVLKEYLI